MERGGRGGMVPDRGLASATPRPRQEPRTGAQAGAPGPGACRRSPPLPALSLPAGIPGERVRGWARSAGCVRDLEPDQGCFSLQRSAW